MRRKKWPGEMPTSAKAEYDFVMARIAEQAKRYPEKEDQTAFLEFILRTVRRDLVAECQSSVLYREEAVNLPSPFPRDFGGSYGEAEVDLSEADILVIPWRMESLWNTLKLIREDGFRFNPDHHMATYYPEIELCYIWNGIHSVASGVFHKTGTIRAELSPLTPLFPIVQTNGESWYNLRDGGSYSVGDFRLAVLYETARKKQKLENGGV